MQNNAERTGKACIPVLQYSGRYEDLPGQKKIVSALAFLRHVLDDELVQDDTSYIVDEVLSEMEGED